MPESVGPTRPLLLGHRGARSLKSIPENTPASFDRALSDGCDGFEFDVRLTADGAAVICHDPQTKGLDIAGALAEQLHHLPQLRDVLARYQERVFLDIELKVAGLEKITAALLRTCPPQRGVVVSSFLPEVLHAVHGDDSEVPLGLICETQAQLLPWKQLPIHYVIPHFSLVQKGLIRDAHGAGKKVFAWTVNSAKEMRKFAEWGVDGIISDDPALLSATLR